MAIRYVLTPWVSLPYRPEDGFIEIDSNAAKRAPRCAAHGRKNFLFTGSDAGVEHAAVIYCLIASAKLKALDPEAHRRYVIGRIEPHSII